MKTRRTLAALMLGFSFALSAPLNASGIPTFDGANLADRAVKFAQEMKEMAEQLKMLQNQLTEMKEQTALLRGAHEVGRAVVEDFKNSIPDEWSEIYTQIGNIDIEPLSAQKYDADRGTKLLVKNIDVLEKALQDTQKGFTDLDRLLDEVNKTQSMKAAADLQNRIAIQQARINNNHTKLAMINEMFKVESHAASVRASEYRSCIYSNHGDLSQCQ